MERTDRCHRSAAFHQFATAVIPEPIARLAERIDAQLSPSRPAQKVQHHGVDLKSMHHRQLRSIGGETVALHALQQLKFEELLASLGIQEKRRKLAIAQVVARMVHPSSERESFRWLCDDSALCELLGLSMSQLKLGALYRSADVMYRHREAIERAMYQRQCELFKHTSSVMLYDLTNTYFSGRHICRRDSSDVRNKSAMTVRW